MEPNLAQEVVGRVVERAQGIAKQIATNIGTPVDSVEASPAESRRLWSLQNPQANPMQVAQLMQAGRHKEAVDMMYPWRSKLIGEGTPQQRVDRANYLAKLAERP
jgi:hypothetical protein